MNICLKPFPFTNHLAVEYTIISESSGVTISVRLSGAVDCVDLAGSFTDELWRGTCVELFVRGEGECYSEWNIAPDGRTTSSELTSYRTIVRSEQKVSSISLVREERSVLFSAELPSVSIENREIAVAVITADREGFRMFWGIDHWEGRPDFHRRENFFRFT